MISSRKTAAAGGIESPRGLQPRRILGIVVSALALTALSAGCGTGGPAGSAGTAGGTGSTTQARATRAALPETGPVPAHFAARSVTFVSPSEGFLLGTAPCAVHPCTSLVRTLNRGTAWAGLRAPRASLIVVSSIVGRRGLGWGGAYAATKFAQVGLADEIALMRNGEILQRGLPEELYDRSANQAVAEFFGPMNCVAGEVVGANRIQTAFGSIEVPVPQGMGRDVMVGLRPERVRINPPDEVAPNVFDGSVLDRVFLGSASAYTLAIGTTTVRADVNGHLTVGEKVRIGFPPAALRVFAKR